MDTEEEFDWSKPFSRNTTSVKHMRHIGKLQSVFDEFALHPVYVVDYQVASQHEGWGPLREFRDTGRASVGAHLHPWVTPPYKEELSARNSYHGNLGKELEFAKLAILTKQIEQSFGFKPVIYKAGRYGVGPNTLSILAELGYQVDLSPAPPLDCSDDGGPDFSRWSCEPFLDPGTGLLVLPGTGAFCGWWRGNQASMRQWATTSWRLKLHANAFLHRSRAVVRLWLTPENFQLPEMVWLTRDLFRRGVRSFVLSLHSPSVMPGGTPYVKDEQDVNNLLKRLSGYLHFFFEELRGEPWTPEAALEYWAPQRRETPRAKSAFASK